MPRLRAHNISMSVDGYMAGADQGLDTPLGVRGDELHTWALATRTFGWMLGNAGAGTTGLDDDMAKRGDVGVGATIMGRNMFGPVRGAWGGSDWRGWWGDEPPYHHPVFVLTHHAHDPIEMAGGTTFHFVTDGIEAAYEQAFAAAGGLDVRLGGGASAIRQYLRAGLLDELHLAIVPMLLGDGERPFDGGFGGLDVYDVVDHVSSDAVTHVRIERRAR